MPAPEESTGRPQRAARNAQAKSAMGKLGAPKAVGLPKPPQRFAKGEGTSVCKPKTFACMQEE